MSQKWYQSRTNQAAIIAGVFLLVATVLGFLKTQDGPNIEVSTIDEGRLTQLVEQVVASKKEHERQDPGDLNAVILNSLTKILREMLKGYDTATPEDKKILRLEVREAYAKFKTKWGLTDWLYQEYIDDCIGARQVLPLSDFLKTLAERQEEHPERTDEIVLYLRDVMLGKKP